jgi:hypothetical protein
VVGSQQRLDRLPQDPRREGTLEPFGQRQPLGQRISAELA